jgi:hypothetical protein
MTELPAAPARFWSAILAAAAAGLALAGDALDNFRPEPVWVPPADTSLPVVEAPQGRVPDPPREFRWTPGGEDVDLAQVSIFRKNLNPVWQSGPVARPPVEVVPEEVFAGVAAGEELFWRVREVRDGRPRATSAMASFTFDRDTQGRGPAESVPEAPWFSSR